MLEKTLELILSPRAMGRDTFRWTRWLQALSSLAMTSYVGICPQQTPDSSVTPSEHPGTTCAEGKGCPDPTVPVWKPSLPLRPWTSQSKFLLADPGKTTHRFFSQHLRGILSQGGDPTFPALTGSLRASVLIL